MKIFSLTLFLTLATLACPIQKTLAMGGAWCAEVSFKLSERTEHGYLILDHWIVDTKSYDFDSVFHSKYDGVEYLDCYNAILDQRKLAAHASFSMHSYELDLTDVRTVAPKEMRDMQLINSWNRDEYHIRVLTPLFISDTSWISSETKVYYPTGQNIGCRIEVHVFEHDPDPTLVEELVSDHRQDAPMDTSDLEQKMALLLALKAKHVVVVELCGC